jgi:hypothetical protein
MTVKELIKQLKKFPQNAKVVWRDHDQSEGEFNGHVNSVYEWCDIDVENDAYPDQSAGVGVVLSV